jgi:hypothetical protein
VTTSAAVSCAIRLGEWRQEWTCSWIFRLFLPGDDLVNLLIRRKLRQRRELETQDGSESSCVAVSPPVSLKCSEIRQDFSGNCEKWAQFQDSSAETGLENTVDRLDPLCGRFLRKAYKQSGFRECDGRMQCDRKSLMRRKRLDFSPPFERAIAT